MAERKIIRLLINYGMCMILIITVYGGTGEMWTGMGSSAQKTVINWFANLKNSDLSNN